MNETIHKLCDDIRALGREFETEESQGNPIKQECSFAKADLCSQLASTIEFSLTGEER